MRIARKIQIHQNGLAFEDEPFFFYVADEPIVVEHDSSSVTRVTVTLLADCVEIDPSLKIETSGDRISVVSA